MQYLPRHAFLASVPAGFSAEALGKLNIRSIVPFDAAMKLAPELTEEVFPDWAVTGDFIELTLSYFDDLKRETVEAGLERAGVNILAASESGPLMNVHLPISEIGQIAALPYISYVEAVPPPPVPDDLGAVSLHRANSINTPYPGGRKYNGEGVKVLVRDDGAVGPHIDFTGRLNNISGGNGGTHGDLVAGCIGGAGNLDPTVMGMAPESEIYVINYRADFQDNTLSLHQNEDVMITNSSYSDGCNDGYTSNSRTVDGQMYNYPTFLHVFSAGNNGTRNCGYGAGNSWGNITGGHKVGKNVITVGSVTVNDGLSGFSSRGPARDGRIKPDIVAMGQGYTTTLPDNDYTSTQGTSFSAPAVAGVATQLYHAYRLLNNEQDPPAALIKAVMLNGADDLGNPGPDFKYGWGRVNAYRSVQYLENKTYIADSLTQGASKQHTISVPAGIRQIKVMAYWIDDPASPAAVTDLVNDFNLTASGPGATSYLPLILDPSPDTTLLDLPAVPGKDSLNNMEQIIIDDPAEGNYVFNIAGTTIPFGKARYFLVYQMETDHIRVSYPDGGEELNPGETERIRWEALGDLGNFTLEYSINKGANWIQIATSLPGSLRHYGWNVPQAFTKDALFRVSRDTLSDVSEQAFSIIPVPENLRVAQVCQDELTLTWNRVQGAVGYEVF